MKVSKQRNGLTFSQAGKLGYQKSLKKLIELKSNRITLYNTNPNSCQFCKVILSYNDRHKKFCNQSCAAQYYNEFRKVKTECLNPDCKQEIFGNSKQKYCSKKCQRNKQRLDFLARWKQNLECGWIGNTVLISNYIRKYLFNKFDYRCSKCNWGERNIYTSKIPLQVHHIDGNAKNCIEENLELLCPNCHSLTNNFGGKNKQSARTNRYA